MAPGTTDRNCRLLLEHEGQTLSPCGSSGRPLCCCQSYEWRSDGCFARSVCRVGHRQEGPQGMRADAEPDPAEFTPPGDPYLRDHDQRAAGAEGLVAR